MHRVHLVHLMHHAHHAVHCAHAHDVVHLVHLHPGLSRPCRVLSGRLDCADSLLAASGAPSDAPSAADLELDATWLTLTETGRCHAVGAVRKCAFRSQGFLRSPGLHHPLL